jgi:hypothetical protein
MERVIIVQTKKDEHHPKAHVEVPFITREGTLLHPKRRLNQVHGNRSINRGKVVCSFTEMVFGFGDEVPNIWYTV